jgi:tRNA-dihydrouridine synthase 3
METQASPFAGRLWLAPLTRGGHLAFRRLCVEFGAEITVGEMVVAWSLLKGRGSEFALLRSHPEEPLFGAQLADGRPDSLAEAGRLAESRGARFLDLNCGCPIHEITRRGLGASLLRKPSRLGRLVEALRKAVSVPVTVKLRSGWSETRPNAAELARVCEEAGASAIVVHGRSREQRYTRACDWDLIARVASERKVPVVGNGDILTHYEARERVARSGVAAVMLGRGALIKPWLFREIREGRSWLPSPEERVGVMWRLVEMLRDHFGDGPKGRERMLGFLPWHLGFFSRYRPLPEAQFGEQARLHPLIQTRWPLGEGLPPLEALLRDPRPDTHLLLSQALLDASGGPDALDRARALAVSTPPPAEVPAPESAGPDLVAG